MTGSGFLSESAVAYWNRQKVGQTGFASSHPHNSNRLKAVKEQVEKLPRRSANVIDEPKKSWWNKLWKQREQPEHETRYSIG